MNSKAAALVLLLLGLSLTPAWAGPPYISDDPEPTDYQHFEIYAFGEGVVTRPGMAGESGMDFNYGGAPDLQLTAVIPLAYDEMGHAGLGNIELAAKYKFLHQDDFGVDVSLFPRIFLPSAAPNVGAQHAAFFLPVWAEKDFDKWSLFGGGGCELNRAYDDRNFCQMGVVLTREVVEGLTLGGEIFHQTADVAGGKVTTSLGAGFTYDINAHYHVLAYWGPGLEHTAENGRENWYSAILFTF